MKRPAAAAQPAAARNGAPAPQARMEGNGDIAISCYENDVPACIEADLERLYGNIYSSLAQYRIYSDGSDTSTYIARRAGETTAVFLFRVAGNRVQVLNEVIRLDGDEIASFSRYAFATYPQVSAIQFKAVCLGDLRLPFPFQRYNHVEDIVLDLPKSPDCYFEMLGKGTKRNFKRHLRHLDERVPSWRYRVLEREQIDRATVDTVIRMNHQRMAGKHKQSDIDCAEAERIWRLARECGLVGVIEIDGRICAGTIAFRSGANYFLNVLAHDPKYDEYWLGILCCYKTICEAIARRGAEFHFLWGEYDYKYMLLGVKRDLDNLIVWRSRLHQVLNPRASAGAVLRGGARGLRRWLHTASRSDGIGARIALAALNRLRAVRHG